MRRHARADVSTVAANAAAVVIEAVDHHKDGGDQLIGSRVEQPRADASYPGFSLPLVGWAAGRDSPARSVRVLCFGEVLWEIPVDVSRPKDKVVKRSGTNRLGFRTMVGAFRLPRQFQIELRAALEDGQEVTIGEIRGRRDSLAPADPAGSLRPAIISSPSGRTGTTWAVNLLGHHPEAVAYPPFGVEPRPAAYWLEAMSALAEPAAYMRSLRPRRGTETWWLGDAKTAREPVPDDRTAAYLANDSVKTLLGFARERTESFYRMVAEVQGKQPSTFVEKAPYGRVRRAAIADLFPGMRELVLFRDPRDTLSSIMAYSERNPNARLAGGVKELEARVDALATSYLGMIGELPELDRSIPILYEDLIRNPAETLSHMLRHLDLDSSEEAVLSTLSAATEDGVPDRHRTTKNPAKSIGRWERDLRPPIRDLANERFAEVLRALGYVGGGTSTAAFPAAVEVAAADAPGRDAPSDAAAEAPAK